MGVVIDDAITYFTCSCISLHWELSLQNRSRELFPARKKDLISMHRGALVSGFVNILVYFNKQANNF